MYMYGWPLCKKIKFLAISIRGVFGYFDSHLSSHPYPRVHIMISIYQVHFKYERNLQEMSLKQEASRPDSSAV